MRTINLGILAHVDAGKTTVTEGLLVHSGVKRRMGRVDEGTTTTDSMALERQRGMTIRAATVSFAWRDTKINLIDTPGHMDFIAEVERSLAVLDGVILVISAREGVQTQTRVIFEKLRAMNIPVMLFVNKVDRMGVTLEAVYANLRAKLTTGFLPMQAVTRAGGREVCVTPLPWEAAEVAEEIIAGDDALMERYLAGDAIAQAELTAAFQAQVRRRAIFPLYFGAALHDIGIRPLLDAVVDCFSQPPASAGAPLSAFIYKVEWDGRDHKWAYLRVLSGALRIREKVAHVGAEEAVYVRGLLAAQDGGYTPAGVIPAGDIGVLMDAPHVRCGDFLGVETELPAVARPSQPLLTVGITPGPAVSRPALLNALQRLTEEDPNLQLSIHPQTEEISLCLYGLLQREIIQALLMERFGLEVTFSPMRTLLKAQPCGPVSAETRIWTAGNLHEAGIALTLVPLPTGSGVVYETQVSYGDLEKSFQNGVAEGAIAGMQAGLGEEIIDTKVIFTDMDYSSVTSTPADYRRLAPAVVQKALESAPLRRLEPWLRFELTAPMDSQKKVLAAVHRLRAAMETVEVGEETFTVRGETPLDTSKTFAAELMSMTQGRGLFAAGFLEYREVDARTFAQQG